MNIYVFASNTLTNIWAGVGAEMWAVAPAELGSSHEKGRITKAKKMPVGGLGILYCSETRELTVPFVVYSQVDETVVVSHVWGMDWVLPFKIKPLGNPHRRMSIDQAKSGLPSFATDPQPAFNHVFRVRADFAFQTSQISSADWSVLIEKLAI
jgi:hypothetical protein